MNSEYVLAYKATGHILAESIVGLLKSFGIDAFASQESAGITYGLTVGALGEARIYVPENQLADAQKLLEQMERGELQVIAPDDSANIPDEDSEQETIDDNE